MTGFVSKFFDNRRQAIDYSILKVDNVKKFCMSMYDDVDRAERTSPISQIEVEQIVQRLHVQPEVARTYLELSGLDANHEFVDTDFAEMVENKIHSEKGNKG